MSQNVQYGTDCDMKIGIQGRRKHLKLGGHGTSRALFP